MAEISMAMGRPALIAWHFLTAIPLSARHHDATPRELALSMRWFPAIGLLIGVLLAAGDVLFSKVFAPGVVDALVIVLLVSLTRGIHQDGLADTFDGLAGGRTPDERLRIMRDSRIGAFGAMALMLALVLRYAGLGAVPFQDRLPLLISMPAVGRWVMVMGAASAAYARPEGGVAHSFLAHLTARDLLWASIFLTLVLFWSLGPLGMLITLLSAGLFARASSWLFARLCGGVTGDTLGATNEMAEVLFLLAGPALMGTR